MMRFRDFTAREIRDCEDFIYYAARKQPRSFLSIAEAYFKEKITGRKYGQRQLIVESEKFRTACGNLVGRQRIYVVHEHDDWVVHAVDPSVQLFYSSAS